MLPHLSCSFQTTFIRSHPLISRESFCRCKSLDPPAESHAPPCFLHVSRDLEPQPDHSLILWFYTHGCRVPERQSGWSRVTWSGQFYRDLSSRSKGSIAKRPADCSPSLTSPLPLRGCITGHSVNPHLLDFFFCLTFYLVSVILAISLYNSYFSNSIRLLNFIDVKWMFCCEQL